MHTPTPWHIQPNDDGNGLVIADETNYWIAITQNDGDDKAEEGANAALIVQAVNAHARLKDALHLVLPLAIAYAHAHPVGSNQLYVDHARALLAEIEGKE